MTSTTKPPVKKRQAFSDQERKDMCEWFADQVQCSPKNQHPHWKEIQKWFSDTHNGKIISQSVISRTLLERSADLVGQTLSSRQGPVKKRRQVEWPELDEALFMWHKKVEKRVPLTGEILKEKARSFFVEIYPDCDTPKFSDGWLDTWKRGHGIREYKQHGESGSSDCSAEAEAEMEAIRKILSKYDLNDTYNVDETGYWYRMQPDRRLCTEQIEGVKKEKARITVALTCNGTGTDKLPLWIIGKSKKPRCFKRINKNALGIVYRNNKTSWMQTKIMIEFLTWFDQRMRGRKVVLLMDNFSAHECGVRDIGGELGLRNTRVIFLPANTTSKWQPLDQGIISAWKAHTRRHYVRYLVNAVDKLSPSQSLPKISLLQAIRWAVTAWNYDVKPSTIFNCFTKSTVKLFEPGPYQLPHGMTFIPRSSQDDNHWQNHDDDQTLLLKDDEELADIRRSVLADLEILLAGKFIDEVTDLDGFLDPVEERIDDDLATLDAQILDTFRPVNATEQIEEEKDEVEHEEIKLGDVMDSLEIISLFELQKDSPSRRNQDDLARMMREMETERVSRLGRQVQQKIDTFFSCNDGYSG